MEALLPRPLPKPDAVAVVSPTTPATAAPAVLATTEPSGRALPSETKIPRGFYVQHGAFRQLSNAENMRQELHEQLGWNPNGGERVYLAPPTKPSKLYRVLVGPFDDRKDAAQWAERGLKVLGTPLVLVAL